MNDIADPDNGSITVPDRSLERFVMKVHGESISLAYEDLLIIPHKAKFDAA